MEEEPLDLSDPLPSKVHDFPTSWSTASGFEGFFQSHTIDWIGSSYDQSDIGRSIRTDLDKLVLADIVLVAPFKDFILNMDNTLFSSWTGFHLRAISLIISPKSAPKKLELCIGKDYHTLKIRFLNQSDGALLKSALARWFWKPREDERIISQYSWAVLNEIDKERSVSGQIGLLQCPKTQTLFEIMDMPQFRRIANNILQTVIEIEVFKLDLAKETDEEKETRLEENEALSENGQNEVIFFSFSLFFFSSYSLLKAS